MEQQENFKDWLFHYQHVYRTRRTAKQKQRFLAALVADIMEIREDIQVIEYNQKKKYAANNLYVGDIETADRIICTYYDTPAQSFGPYYLFDRKKQSKATMNFILVSSLLMILAGGLLTFLYMNHSGQGFNLSSLGTVLMIVCYGIYFYLLSKVTKGLSVRKNLIRNTSSILSLLTLMSKTDKQKTAFAFVDEGCYGDTGLEVLKDSCKASAKIYYLDCVGADAELHIVGNDVRKDQQQLFDTQQRSNDRVNQIFSARVEASDQGKQYYLEKAELKAKTVNHDHLAKLVEFFK